jgi:hypothetical protein
MIRGRHTDRANGGKDDGEVVGVDVDVDVDVVLGLKPRQFLLQRALALTLDLHFGSGAQPSTVCEANARVRLQQQISLLIG